MLLIVFEQDNSIFMPRVVIYNSLTKSIEINVFFKNDIIKKIDKRHNFVHKRYKFI